MRHYTDPEEQLIAQIARQIAAERGEQMYPPDIDRVVTAYRNRHNNPPPIVTGPGGDYRQPYTPRPWQRDTVTWWLCWIITGLAAGVLLAAVITIG